MTMSQQMYFLFDNPTDHLDLEFITSLNKALIKFPGTNPLQDMAPRLMKQSTRMIKFYQMENLLIS